MWFDAWCASRAAAAGVPLHVHHHSWACLEDGGLAWYRRGAFARLRPHRHWVLCEAMRERLVSRHAVEPEAVGVLSNAALCPPVVCGGKPVRPPPGVPFTLGFFSNVVASKGIGAFLDVVERLQGAGRLVAARVAGPVDASIATFVHGRLAALRDARYVGALRGDADKRSFFAGVHRLLLPSRHVHEAEPLVVIEALAHGVPVIATDRGCLPTAWAHPRVVRLFAADAFVDAASVAIAASMDAPDDLAADAAAATAWHRARHDASRAQREAALAEITQAPPAD